MSESKSNSKFMKQFQYAKHIFSYKNMTNGGVEIKNDNKRILQT